LEKQIKAELKGVQPRTFLWVGYTGPNYINVGYDLTYTYDFYGKHFEGKDFIPRNSDFPVNQMIKELKNSTNISFIQIRIAKDNPTKSQIVVQPLVYY